jgi:hypothetical protein
MEDMIRLVDRWEGVLARVSLPSWGRWTQTDPPFDETYWPELLAAAEGMRAEVRVPIHIMPHMIHLRTLRPVIQGAITGSPAAAAGLGYGDVITEVEGETVFTRAEVIGLLSSRFEDETFSSTRLTVQRGDLRLERELSHSREPEDWEYPYNRLVSRGGPRVLVNTLGLFLPDSFQLTSFLTLKGIVERYAGQRILLFISELGDPLFREGMSMLGPLANFVDSAEVYLEKLLPRYWGGNVVLGDLWTTHDVIRGAREWMDSTGLRPDVIVVPETFLGMGGRDLIGRPWVTIEQALGIRVQLLPCNRIML